MYFVALEALANCQKHAPAARVTISLRRDAETLRLDVHDNGPGFNRSAAAGAGGNGMLNMADRMAAVGGGIEVESRPGAGTWISATAPAVTLVTPLVEPASGAEG